MKSFLSLTAIVTLVATPIAAAPKVCAECVKSDMTRLAGPAARGRACGAAEEHAAAGFVAERLKAHGVAPAAPAGGYLQEVRFHVPTYAALPTLTVHEGDPKTLKSIMRRTVPWDLIVPPRDRGGEATGP